MPINVSQGKAFSKLKKINQRLRWIAFATLVSFLMPAQVMAAWTPTRYIVTVKSLELKNNTGEWVKVIEPDLEVDLLSRDPRVSYVNDGKRIPKGNYINFRIVLSETIRIKGHDYENFTKEGGEIKILGNFLEEAELNVTGVDEIKPTWTANAEEEGVIKVYFDVDDKSLDDQVIMTRKRDFPEPFYIKKGSYISASFSLNLEGTLIHAQKASLGGGLPKNDIMFGMIPRNVNELVFLVDEAREVVPNSDIAIAF